MKRHYVAIISQQSVTVQLDTGRFELPSEEALTCWIDDNGLEESDGLKVTVVNSCNT